MIELMNDRMPPSATPFNFYLLPFNLYLSTLGYNKHTATSLPRHVACFFAHYPGLRADQVTPEHVAAWKAHLEIRPSVKGSGGLSTSYIYQHIYALNVYFSWQQTTGALSINPVHPSHYPESRPGSRDPLSQEEVKTLFGSCESLTELALLHIYYSCGLRRAEGQALNTRDIHFKEQILYVRSGKGNKRRAIPLSGRVAADLEACYLHERVVRDKVKEPDAFFLNNRGRRMSCDSLNAAFKKILQRTSLPPTTSPHHLRHSIATHLLDNGLNLEKIQLFLGHSQLETTQLYVKVSKEMLARL